MTGHNPSMGNGSAATALYRADSATSGTCHDCSRPLPEDAADTRRYCDRDRARRRALSYARAARGAATEARCLSEVGELNSVIRGLERVR